MKTKLFGAAVAALLSSHAFAAVTSYSGLDDGEVVGGGSANASVAQAGLLAAAVGYGPVLTNYFDLVGLGFNAGFAMPGANVALAAVDLGPGRSGVTNVQLNPPGTGLYGYSTIESNTDNARWLGFPGGTATFSLNRPSNSFGFFFTGVESGLNPLLSISFNGAGGQVLNAPITVNGGVGYFGFTSDDPFDQVSISRSGGDNWGIDGVTFNGVAGVPEPSSWLMFILGFGLTGHGLRRRAGVVAA